MSRGHVVHVLTVADSLIFIDTLVAETLARGFEVTVVTSPDERLEAFAARLGIQHAGIPMPRRITPRLDWSALEALHRRIRALRPSIVHAHTPKGGLLGTLAARAAGVPVRVYHMRGLLFLTQTGTLRAITTATERLACAAATRVLCQSPSLQAAAAAHRVAPLERLTVVLKGSNGVDLTRYRLEDRPTLRARLRQAHGIPAEAPVVGFVGRVVKDKGIEELLASFDRLPSDCHLLIAGPLEARDAVSPATVERLRAGGRIHHLGFVADPRPAYAASDVLVLPSHREGFPNVPLEAAAMGLPVVTTTAPGCLDSVEDGVTGTLVPVGDVGRLTEAIRRYVDDAGLRQDHGQAGRARVESSFRREVIARATVDLYERDLARAPQPELR